MSAPWWETELARLKPLLLSSLARRTGRDPAAREDILHDTMLSITLSIRNHPGSWPCSWLESSPPPPQDQARFRRFARTVLRRRLADQHRGGALRWAQLQQESFTHSASLPSRGDHSIQMGQILTQAVGILALLPEEDRALVSHLIDADPRHEALTPKERKRIERIRNRLRAAMSEALGEDIASLLAADPSSSE